MHFTHLIKSAKCSSKELLKFISNTQQREFSISDFFKKKPKSFGQYNIVTPGVISKINEVPENIKKPPYDDLHNVPQYPEVKSPEQISFMRSSCKLAANILNFVGKNLKVGMTTDEIDKIVHNLAITNGAYPSPLHYKSFPKSVCTSVNNVACHGIPDDRRLEDGDIINVDVTVYLNGYHGDGSKTFLVGNVDYQGRNLIEANEYVLQCAIETCQPGIRFSTLGFVIESLAKEKGFDVLPQFCGHGIGSYFHGPPDIYHCLNDYPGKMQPGMTFTIEPVLGQGSREIEILEDNWTCVTVDNSRTSQVEHTVLITETGAEILTVPDDSVL